MYCNICGKEINDEQNLCNECAKKRKEYQKLIAENKITKIKPERTLPIDINNTKDTNIQKNISVNQKKLLLKPSFIKVWSVTILFNIIIIAKNIKTGNFHNYMIGYDVVISYIILLLYQIINIKLIFNQKKFTNQHIICSKIIVSSIIIYILFNPILNIAFLIKDIMSPISPIFLSLVSISFSFLLASTGIIKTTNNSKNTNTKSKTRKKDFFDILAKIFLILVIIYYTIVIVGIISLFLF